MYHAMWEHKVQTQYKLDRPYKHQLMAGGPSGPGNQSEQFVDLPLYFLSPSFPSLFLITSPSIFETTFSFYRFESPFSSSLKPSIQAAVYKNHSSIYLSNLVSNAKPFCHCYRPCSRQRIIISLFLTIVSISPAFLRMLVLINPT